MEGGTRVGDRGARRPGPAQYMSDKMRGGYPYGGGRTP